MNVTNFCVKCKIKRSIYNVPEETKPKYCKNCKTNNMINVINKLCLCKKQERVLIFLVKNHQYVAFHVKKDNMIDMVNKKYCLCDKDLHLTIPRSN